MKINLHGMDFDYKNATYSGDVEKLIQQINDGEVIQVTVDGVAAYINSSYIIDFCLRPDLT